MSEWVEMPEIAAALGVPAAVIEASCEALLSAGLLESSPPDEENENWAALITVKGLLAIGRVP